jgi:CRP-like cAMP-binding protein
VTIAQNQLIDSLPERERGHLLAACESVTLRLGEALCERGQLTAHVYFPVDGFISLVSQLDAHPGLEVGMVGREGMLGAQLVLGVHVVPLHALVQGPGTAWRIPRVAFLRELRRCPALTRCLLRYVHVLKLQLASAAGCLRYHLIGPRLARWLLMSQDRAHADSFRVTHEFLSYMLGVRRVGVTMAAGVMQREGLIRYHRGELQVLDREALHQHACSCYDADRQNYREVMA